MKKIKGYIWPTLLALAVAIGIFIGGKLHFNDSPEKLFSTNSKKDKLNRLIDYIDYEYVDDVDTDSIVDVTVNNILGKLDPHSVYIPKDEMKDVAESMKGDFAGIGISFYMYRDTITVIRTIKNGPSYISGIKPGDRILMAGNDTLFGKRIPNDDIVSTLKGKIGTKVNLKVLRKTENKLMDIDVVRNKVPIRSVDAYYMMSSDMGYIKINRFAETTFDEFKDALRKLKLRGAEKLTLDLRDNPGGYLGIAEKLADEFLGDDKLILFTKNKRGKIEKAYATKKGDFEDKPVFVLINERSASASEIIAGALQDNDIGTIVGRRSFGKGLVQREMDLGDGSAVRLTVSRYYTPTGRSIQKSYKDGNHDYYKKFMERYSSGELTSADSIKVADSLKFVTPKGKIVYGGGGIIPDVFVPIGSNQEEAIESMDDTYQFFARFIFEHLEEDRTRYEDYDQNEFLDNFKVDDILFDNFIQFVLDRKIKLDFYAYEDKIKAYLKANIAEQLFSPNVSAQIKGEHDAMLQKVKAIDETVMNQSQIGAVGLRQ
ncbi:S41 family peptidase [Flagellimonas zhangzhouensis]|uniref:Carboxyl-terminal processing protease n=1 Tax=Flagellimonas zhangzhouensis TaxID=1073328 RepID=A0A1H2UGF1_9FLAO|nr:S41 family peptidase [Allomuricauda zhangzhouensis]SDQ17325.1 carboxyl-terminal processing protease [Allomuricauda zhangzhouensis]SDW55186.1 carboxyl-terminal processing protease [Allomuricauda zhangzhouensis]